MALELMKKLMKDNYGVIVEFNGKKVRFSNCTRVIFNYTDIKRFVDIGLLKSIDEDKLNLLNTHDIHDYNDLFDLRNSHDFHEEQRIFQKNLNNYFGY